MTLPDVTFKTRVRVEYDEENPFVWKDLTTADYFKGKKCVLFSLPGAFTPVCSATHLPRYQELYDEFKKLGVDEVYCLSVNDAFVMRKWGLDQGLEEDMTPGSLGFTKVKLIPDGTGKFTEGMDMLVHKPAQGFGYRSWRYAMHVIDGDIQNMWVEEGKNQLGLDDDPYKMTAPLRILGDL